MDYSEILSRLEALETLVSKHDDWLSELVSKQAHSEMVERIEYEKEIEQEEPSVFIQEKIVVALRKNGIIETVGSDRVKRSARELIEKLSKDADAARERLKKKGF